MIGILLQICLGSGGKGRQNGGDQQADSFCRQVTCRRVAWCRNCGSQNVYSSFANRSSFQQAYDVCTFGWLYRYVCHLCLCTHSASDDSKNKLFDDALEKVLRAMPRECFVMFLGDLNASICLFSASLSGLLGPWALTETDGQPVSICVKTTDNRARFLDFVSATSCGHPALFPKGTRTLVYLQASWNWRRLFGMAEWQLFF